MKLRQRQVTDPDVERHGVLFGSHRRKQSLGFRPAGSAGERRRRKLEIFENRHFLGQLGVLEGHRHAGPVQFLGVGSLDFLAGHAKDRKVGRHGPGGNADERGFSRAVLPDDGVHLAAPDGEVDSLERLHRAVILCRPHDPHDRGAQSIRAGAHSVISSRFFSRR